jgi:hypothetical protein
MNYELTFQVVLLHESHLTAWHAFTGTVEIWEIMVVEVRVG